MSTKHASHPGVGRTLAAAVADTPARRVLVGINWTLVEGENGCGLAQTPARGSAGCRPLDMAGDYAGRGLNDLAAMIESDNRFEAAIGWAAINAHYNRRDIAGPAVNGLALLAQSGDSGRTVIVGRFPDLNTVLPSAQVIEREPRDSEFPESAAAELLPGAARVGITASALLDGAAERMIAMARGARIAVIGPSTPLAPALHDLGVAILAGLVIDDADRAARVVAEAGAVKALKRCGRFVTLVR